jgi:hypothetical protein
MLPRATSCSNIKCLIGDSNWATESLIAVSKPDNLQRVAESGVVGLDILIWVLLELFLTSVILPSSFANFF